MASIQFGTDGWRGIIAEDFTFANARTVAEAIARYVVRGEDARKGVIVGYDHRYASDTVAHRPALPNSCSFLSSARARSGRRCSCYREPQSLPMERNQIQG